MGGPNSGVSQKGIVPEEIEANNFGPNVGLQVVRDRQRNASKNELKYILFWNEAYGSKEYDLGFGREPFYNARCPETRCFTTANRNLKKHEDWKDIPDRSKRREEQRYVHFIMESAQYLYMDIHDMDNFFNWTITYRFKTSFNYH